MSASSPRQGWKWGLALGLLLLLVANLALLSAQGSGTDAWWAGGGAKMAARILAVGFALALWFWTQALIGSRKGGAGIGDALHDWSEPWNAYLQSRPKLANGILVASSGFIDFFGLFLIAAGLLGSSLRPFIGLLLVFVFRQGCQAICTLPIPPRMIWRNPGFPSLLVTYGVANDFFISGHTAIAVLGAIEISRMLPWGWGLAAGLVALGEATVVIVFRAHYTMDVLAAAAAAGCAAALAGQLCAAFGI
jgi:hypothetical protein